jgi:hypothetical protein
LLTLAACGPGHGYGRHVSRGDPVAARLDEVPVCGFTVRVELGPPYPGAISGELLAATDGELDVLTDRELARVPRAQVERVVVNVLPQIRYLLAGGTVLGALSTPTHGVYLMVSLPLWLILGFTDASVAADREAIAFRGGAPELREYARFPQGLPSGWPRSDAVPRCTRPPPDAKPSA